jgi:hypothetical protein
VAAQESIAQTGLTGAQITPWQWQLVDALLYQELVSIYLPDCYMIMFFSVFSFVIFTLVQSQCQEPPAMSAVKTYKVRTG